MLLLMAGLLLFEIAIELPKNLQEGGRPDLTVLWTYSSISAPCILLMSWLAVRFLTSHFLVVYYFSPRLAKSFTLGIVRMLASVPTLIIGNVMFTVLRSLDIVPVGASGGLVIVLSALVALSLPTALQISIEASRDYDPKQLQQALSLGLHPFFVGRQIMLRGIRRSFLLSTFLAIGRVILEAYIVFRQSITTSGTALGVGKWAEICQSLYSTMTVKDNIWLILVLFVLGLVFGVWSGLWGSAIRT